MKFARTGLALAFAGTLAGMPLQASATDLKFLNPDNGTFVDVTALDLTATTGNYNVFVTLGADNLLTNGDTFTETLDFYVTSSSVGGGATSGALAFDYLITASLTGTIQNVAGTGLSINGGGGVDGLATTSFNVVFGGATLSLFVDDDNDDVIDLNIADLLFLSGGNSSVQLVAGQLIGDTVLNAFIDTASEPFVSTGDNFIKAADGSSIVNATVLTVTSASARFIGATGVLGGDNIVTVEFQDDQGSTTFDVPTPGTLALMGLGLFAASRRRKSVS